MHHAFQDVIRFEEACGHPPTSEPPGIPSEHVFRSRMRLMIEEFDETLVAMCNGDLPEIADGLADLIFVAIGTAVRFGIDLPRVWDAVAAANLRKLGPGAHRKPNGKWLKPEGWVHPDIGAILEAQPPLARIYGPEPTENRPRIDPETFPWPESIRTSTPSADRS